MFKVSDQLLKDEFGRAVLLRGVNLSGNCKIPFNANDQEYIETFFSQPHKVTFVNRPFPLEEADEHFARLKHWGFYCNRLLICWEAIEHNGPGIYDEDYLDYLEKLVTIGEKYGMFFYIDPHQDVWSRLTSGDGAPGWTYEKLGFVPANFKDTAASDVNLADPLWHRDWPDEYGKLAPATMFTLFFGGNVFAPATMVDGEHVQDYLQRCYVNAFKQVVQRFKNHPNVFACGGMNEPSRGYITWADLNSSSLLRYARGKGKEKSCMIHHRSERKAYVVNLRMKLSPSPFQSMLLGDGIPQHVDNWGILFGPMRFGKKWVNTEKKRVWRDDVECVWKQNGVWGFDSNKEPVLKRPDHFSKVNGKDVDFENDYLKPFGNYMAKEIRTITPSLVYFVQSTPMFPLPHYHTRDGDATNVMCSSHWYDYFSIFTGMFFPFFTMDFYRNGKFIFGGKHRRRIFERQLSIITDSSRFDDGDMPDIIGEFGVGFSMPFKLNFLLNWFGAQTAAMDASFQVMEALKLHSTIYNYTPTNTNSRGDGWNTEDLSIFSRSEQKNPADLNSGARTLKAFLRPYPKFIAGKISLLNYDMKKRVFILRFHHFENMPMPTEIFIPATIYSKGFNQQLSDGTATFDSQNQMLLYHHTSGVAEHQVVITPK